MVNRTRINGQYIRQIASAKRQLALLPIPQVYTKKGLTNTRAMDKIIGRFRLIAVRPDTARSISSPKCFSWPLASLKSVQKRQLKNMGGPQMKKMHANLSQITLKAKKEYLTRIDLLRTRMSLLTGKDKLLMTMYLDKGNSFRQMARLAGVNDTIIARRIHKLIKRLIDGEYITCLRNCNKFTKTEMAIAKDYFLTGLSMKKIAAKQHLTYYRVREILKKIQQVIELLNHKG